MQLNEKDKERTIRQLADMFSEIPRKKIQWVCKQHGWKLEDCIDQLVSVGVKTESAVSTRNALPATWISACFQFQNGAIPKTGGNMNSQKQVHISKYKAGSISNNSYTNTSSNISDQQRIVELVSSGFRVMVIMRGVPGSGKSTLAKSLVEQSVPLSTDYTWKDFVLSTDDMFIDPTGRYNFCVERLSEMHNCNQRRAFQKAAGGWSPIFIDNTNMQLWEMLPYVKVAVLHGYIIEILELKTAWRSASKLARRNHHGVPRDAIEMMLTKYENGSVRDLIKMLKNTKYTVPLPQMRLHPLVISSQQDVETEENVQIFQNSPVQALTLRHEVLSSLSINASETAPKAQRTRSKTKERISICNIDEAKDCVGLLEKTNHDFSWKPHEDEIALFWGQSKDTVPDGSNFSKEKTLLDLLKEDTQEKQSTNHLCNKNPDDSATTHAPHSIIMKHRINCPYENEAFVSLRQMYPNKQPGGLWDLFVKCNCDIDWAVDILLKEDDLSIKENEYFTVDLARDNENVFTCCCEFGLKDSTFKAASPQSIVNVSSLLDTSGIKPQRQRTRASRRNHRDNITPPRQNQRLNNALNEIKSTLEVFSVIKPEYSEHMHQTRDMRNAVGLCGSTMTRFADAETQTAMLEEEEPENEDDGDLLEITVGNSLIKQLSCIFKSDTTTLGNELSESNSPLKLFMPSTLAKEVYMLCLESAYNQLEETRQRMLHADEDFARLLKIPKYENCQQSPSNMRELLDTELAWRIYNDERTQKLDRRHAGDAQEPADLALHLTHLKLIEAFPDIPRETLQDILTAHGNRYGETVEVLRGTVAKNNECTIFTEQKLLDRTIYENGVPNQQVDMEVSREQWQQSQADLSTRSNYMDSYTKSPLQPDEAKRIALLDFEEMRNLAAHHCQLKAECYQKAKEAIQKGNNAVAVYYSQIASLHKKKIDMYNHRAANCIVAVHKYTQNNPDLLDLHYLHALEAIGCLDLFLDRHITALRSVSRSYKHIFIITGRGLHSAGGVSTIKNKVKSRLKERNLRWSEVNPGLLKVKIFSASRYSKNIL